MFSLHKELSPDTLSTQHMTLHFHPFHNWQSFLLKLQLYSWCILWEEAMSGLDSKTTAGLPIFVGVEVTYIKTYE